MEEAIEMIEKATKVQ